MLLSEVWEKGGEGGIALAEKVLDTLEKKESHFHPFITMNYLWKKRSRILPKKSTEQTASFMSRQQRNSLRRFQKWDLPNFRYVWQRISILCQMMQRNSEDRPDFDIHIREVYVSAGAGFVVALTGAVMTMPGLPKVPAANGIDVTDDGKITGLF